MKPLLSSLSLLCIAAVSSWAACPSPAPNFVGTKWSFQVWAGEPAPRGSAAIGTFTAQPNGILSVTETISNEGVITRWASHGGRYILYPDCTGGELMFMANGHAAQYEFVFASNFEEMFLVTDSLLTNDPVVQPIRIRPVKAHQNVVDLNGARGFYHGALTGVAKLTPATGCPVGTGNPANLLNGTAWAFVTKAAYNLNLRPILQLGVKARNVADLGDPFTNGSGSVGVFAASVVNGQGVLSAIETVNAEPSGAIARRTLESGRYQVYGDCVGGEIMLMNRGIPLQPVQLEFVFAGKNFDEVFFLNDRAPMNNLDLVEGRGKRFPVAAPTACPADPASLIVGTNWSFKLAATDYVNAGSAAIGTFKVLPGGLLDITETISNNGILTRWVTHGGKYILYPDCTGGELLFYINGFSVQLEFVYGGSTDELFLVNDNTGGGGFGGPIRTAPQLNGRLFTPGQSVLVGVALKTPQSCTANPLDKLNGKTYSFRTATAYSLDSLPNLIMRGMIDDPSVGIFTASVSNGAGVLKAIETINAGGTIVRRAEETGRYQVYSGCAGGELLLMNRGIPSNPVHLEFVFAGNDQLFLLSDTPAVNQLNVLEGTAKLF